MSEYKHGTYGNLAESVGAAATQSGSAAVYVGIAPVHLTSGFADRVNAPVKLSNIADVHNYMGYSADWNSFDLCEAFNTHFDNAAGNVGPIVAINVLDPATHKKADDTTVSLNFVNGRANIVSDTIILDSLVLADLVRDTDYSVRYNFTKGQVVIESIGDAITGSVNATYSEVDVSAITAEDIIGEATDAGIYSGLGCVGLVYPTLNIKPAFILCPKWSGTKAVYDAMVVAATNINGHWNCVVYADIPISETTGGDVDTIDKANTWATTNGYNKERSKVFWPQGLDSSGRARHVSVVWAWRQMLVDASHDGIPMESASNKSAPIVKQYFGANSKSRGFDQQQANKLNANGITTIVFWGSQWVLWGPHTAAYKHGAVTDNRSIFDASVRMMFHVLNSFQEEHALTIDQPMTRSLADSIRNREQEKVDALAAVGAFIGTPVVQFLESSNPTSDMVEGNFTWDFKGTPTPPFKAGTLNVAYTTEGFNSYFEEV